MCVYVCVCVCWKVIGDPSGVEESSSCQAQQVIGEALKVCVCVCVCGGDRRPLWCGGVFFLSGTAGHR